MRVPSEDWISILFYSILFYSILFYSILFLFLFLFLLLFYSILFYSKSVLILISFIFYFYSFTIILVMFCSYSISILFHITFQFFLSQCMFYAIYSIQFQSSPVQSRKIPYKYCYAMCCSYLFTTFFFSDRWQNRHFVELVPL